MGWMSDEKQSKFGKCPICGQTRWLQFAMGTHKGSNWKIWCDWICNDCYVKLRDKTDDKEVVE